MPITTAFLVKDAGTGDLYRNYIVQDMADRDDDYGVLLTVNEDTGALTLYTFTRWPEDSDQRYGVITPGGGGELHLVDVIHLDGARTVNHLLTALAHIV